MGLAGHLQLNRDFGNYWGLTAAQRSFMMGKKEDTGKDTESNVKVARRLTMEEMREMTRKTREDRKAAGAVSKVQRKEKTKDDTKRTDT